MGWKGRDLAWVVKVELIGMLQAVVENGAVWGSEVIKKCLNGITKKKLTADANEWLNMSQQQGTSKQLYRIPDYRDDYKYKLLDGRFVCKEHEERGMAERERDREREREITEWARGVTEG